MAVRASLLFLSITDLVVGIWALVLPQAFYTAFPGFG